jgi:NAD-specific glutamate dehydrogenase
VLRRLLERLEKDFGFEPSGHSGKALRHAIGSLPRDLLINLRYDEVKELAATAISLADRPRPTLDPRPLDPQGAHVRLRLAAARRAHHAAGASRSAR